MSDKGKCDWWVNLVDIEEEFAGRFFLAAIERMRELAVSGDTIRADREPSTDWERDPSIAWPMGYDQDDAITMQVHMRKAVAAYKRSICVADQEDTDEGGNDGSE